jgi:hypothetical protein
MGESTERCAVCADHEASDADGAAHADARPRSRMARVVIQGRALCLCRAHAGTVAAAMPETFEEMRALFVGLPRNAPPSASSATATATERRSPISRRNPDERRVFPPRPEGRRLGGGRRATDPVD